MKNHVLRQILLFVSLFLLPFYASAETAAPVKYKPFILAKTDSAELNTVATQTKQALTSNGFQVVGEYSPYADTNIIVITNDELRNNAEQSEFGAFGAALRVTLTKGKDGVQVSYMNPVYMSHVYRMKSDLANVKSALGKALGNKQEYGPEQGLEKEALRDYQYKWLMPYFSDVLELAKYPDQQTALKKVDEIFKSDSTGVKKVYQVDLPNKAETVIGVNMTGKNNECSGDQYIMSRIDFKPIKSAGHLPYEIIVTKGWIYMLPAEFRIAINFPDLSMMGDNSFASIMCAPGAIKKALTKAAGGKLEE